MIDFRHSPTSFPCRECRNSNKGWLDTPHTRIKRASRREEKSGIARRSGHPDDQWGNTMRSIVLFAALSTASMLVSHAQAQDAAAGEKVFAKCKACHVADEDKNKIGPSLHGLIGRTAGTHEGFKYSPAMVAAGAGGLVWDEAHLKDYLHDPKAKVPGTKMAFPGLKSDDDIANVVAYLKQFTP
jgi:cytochrome c